jgi:membrane protein YqaA with SNARE-associated domain
MIVEWLLAWSLAVVLNVIPAFMPPTWSLLAYFHLNYAFPILPLAAVGATAATTGRGLLALASRAFGARFLSKKRQENLQSLATVLRQRKAVSVPLLLPFVLGPVPSNELAIAAGLAKVPLRPLLVIFGLARFVSYLLWVKTAATVAQSLWDVLTPSVGSEVAVAVQIVGLLLVIALVRVDWTRVLQRWTPIESQLHSK